MHGKQKRGRAKSSPPPVSLAVEDLFRDLVEHSRDLICTHDLTGRLLSVNPLPAKLLGYSVEELLQKPMRSLLAPEFRDQFDAYLDRVQKNGSDSGMLLLMTRGGDRRIWEYNNTLRTEGMPVPLVRGMAHDVTERHRAEVALRKMVQERERLVVSLQGALEKVKLLSGLLPTCCYCKKIRDTDGVWHVLEAYIQNHSEATFSHGICPDCVHRMDPQSARPVLRP
jgi:PAS domain S-box-containing protein